MKQICVKYRLYPTRSQETTLKETLEVCRLVYNSMLAHRKRAYEREGKSLTRFSQEKVLSDWKRERPRLASVHAHLLQNVAVRVDLAFQAFFRRVKAGEEPGYPRFKGEGQYDSFTFKEYGNGCRLEESRLKLSKIGRVKTIVHRPLPGTPKTCTVRRYGNKWFACILCEVEPEPLPPSDEAVGIDVGLEKFASLSNGEFIENPRFFRREEKALAKAQRKLEKRPKGSLARKKARKGVSRIHERTRNKRHNFIHQESRKLVNRFGVIAVEKLKVRNMSARPKPKKDEETGECPPNGASRKAGLNRSILDASWSQFRFALAYKAENAGRLLVEVNPAYTSQDCSGCGYRAKKTLKERWHFCPMCSLSLDRDTNAALNLLALGLQSVEGLAPPGSRADLSAAE